MTLLHMLKILVVPGIQKVTKKQLYMSYEVFSNKTITFSSIYSELLQSATTCNPIERSALSASTRNELEIVFKHINWVHRVFPKNFCSQTRTSGNVGVLQLCKV